MPELREVERALDSLSRSGDLEKLKGMDATIVFDIAGADGGLWTVEVEDGQVRVEEGAAESADVTVEATSEDLIGLIKGDLNPMAAFMQGRLKVKGNLSIAMQLQKLFSS